jgi:uncharacterized membrane protein YGL010W
MRNFEDHVVAYAHYHHNPRNLATHFIGVPLIVFSVAVMLSRPQFSVGDWVLTPAMVAATGAALFYLRLHLGFGLILSALLALCVWAGLHLGAMTTSTWLLAGVGVFVVGWVLQFIGHVFEGKKPAFVDDLIGLLQGPLFLLVEIALALGWRPDLKARMAAA